MSKQILPDDIFTLLNSYEDRLARLERATSPMAWEKIGDFQASGTLQLVYNNIPQTFSHLRVAFVGQSTRSGFTNTGYRFYFSTSAGLISSSYQMQYFGYSSQSGAFVSGQSPNDSRGYLGQCPAGTRSNDNYILSGTIDIPYYARGDVIKNFMVDSTMHDGSTLFQGLRVHTINNATAAAVTALTIADDAGSALGPRAAATLYGIR
jgi:hypothetical protein